MALASRSALTSTLPRARYPRPMETSTAPLPGGSTLDPAEVARFDQLAGQWWDPKGKFRPLHRQGPARLTFIRDALLSHFGRPGDRASLPQGPLDPRRRVRRRPDLRAARPARCRRDRHRPQRRGDRGCAPPRRGARPRHRLPGDDGRGSLRDSGAASMPSPASRSSSTCPTWARSLKTLSALVRPGGIIVLVDAEPHLESVGAGDRRRRVRARLAAARHARLEPVRDAGRACAVYTSSGFCRSALFRASSTTSRATPGGSIPIAT